METSTKNILILGSGMMVEPLIDFLIRNPNNRIKVGTNMIHTIKSIIERKKTPNLSAEEIDVLQDKEKLNLLVKDSDIVVSYLPPFLHETIAKECLKEKKNMMTTSYVSDAVYKLDKEVKEAGLIFMNEIGLDPGIDHLITHKVINEAKARGDKIIHYESWCGALCSPEFLNNPLLYKFTWSPRGALLALKNNAKQFKNQEIIHIPSNELLTKTTNKNFQSCFNFEGYYNRDSLTYKELYDLTDAETVIRGTIRFKGFSLVMQCLKNLNLFEDSKIVESIENWRNFFYLTILTDEKNVKLIKSFMDVNVKPGEEFFITDKNPEESCFDGETKFYTDLSMFALSKFTQEYLKENNFKELFKKINACLKYLDLYDDSSKLKSHNVLDAFAILLEDKLKMQDWERDMVFMQNEFKLRTKEGKIVNKKYDLVVFGGHNGLPYSAVSLLVSMPCAITTQLVLDGKVKDTGVLRPFSDVVIDTVLKEMEKEKVYIVEHIERKIKF